MSDFINHIKVVNFLNGKIPPDIRWGVQAKYLPNSDEKVAVIAIVFFIAPIDLAAIYKEGTGEDSLVGLVDTVTARSIFGTYSERLGNTMSNIAWLAICAALKHSHAEEAEVIFDFTEFKVEKKHV